MKLKSLLSEASLKVLERKFGEPLPTLEDTTRAYRLKKEEEVKEGELPPALKKAIAKKKGEEDDSKPKMTKEDIENFNKEVDTEDLWKLVSGPKGINLIVKNITGEIVRLVTKVKRNVLDDLRGGEYKSHRREWKKLEKEIYEQEKACQRAAYELYDLGKKYAKWVESVKK